MGQCLSWGQKDFLKKVKTRWHSMKDRFNRDLRTHSSTLEPGPASGSVLHETPSDPSQTFHSEGVSRPAAQSGEPAAGPSGLLLSESSAPPFYGSSCQRQRGSDRPLLPEFVLLGTVFQNCFKALGDTVQTGLSNVTRRLEQLEVELQRPARHFFSAIEKGVSENLTPELQLTMMQACNAAYVNAMQQTLFMQPPPAAAFPPIPQLLSLIPSSAAYHCTSTTMPTATQHHYTMPGAGDRHYTTSPSPDHARTSTTTRPAPHTEQTQGPALTRRSTTTRPAHHTEQMLGPGHTRRATTTRPAHHTEQTLGPGHARRSTTTRPDHNTEQTQGTLTTPTTRPCTSTQTQRSHQSKKRKRRTVHVSPPSPPTPSPPPASPTPLSLPSHVSPPNVSTSSIPEVPTSILGTTPSPNPNESPT